MRRLATLVLLVSSLALFAGPARAAGITARRVVGGLNFPAAFTFAPDGRIFYAEHDTGAINIYDPANGRTRAFCQISSLATGGEHGVNGIAVDPRFPSAPYVYAYATRSVGGVVRNQIVRMSESGSKCRTQSAIWSGPALVSPYHDSGRILFGPDGKLYAVVGDNHDDANAQNLGTTAGKVLRINSDGSIPSDNPFPGSPILAYGIRNSFGFTFDPLTRRLWETENGPACNDEINRILAGRNYGWGPRETCATPPAPPVNTNQDGPSPVLPISWFTPTIAPTGAAFCSGCGLSGSDGTLLFGNYNRHQIRRAVLTSARYAISSISTVYTHTSGILSVERAPGGQVYFSDATAIYQLVNA